MRYRKVKSMRKWYAQILHIPLVAMGPFLVQFIVNSSLVRFRVSCHEAERMKRQAIRGIAK